MAILKITPANTGTVHRTVINPEDWETIIRGAGTGALNHQDVIVRASNYEDIGVHNWIRHYRGILVFDTSPLSGKDIVDAYLNLNMQKGKYEQVDPDLGLYLATPIEPLNLEAADYLLFGTESLSDIKLWDDIATGWNIFSLNENGLAALNRSGLTVFGLRFATYDVDETPPLLDPGGFLYAEDTFLFQAAGDYHASRPVLSVYYEAPPAGVLIERAPDIGPANVVLYGMVHDTGELPCDGGFEWGQATGYGESITVKNLVQAIEYPCSYCKSHFGDAAFHHAHFNALISGLQANTFYHYRAWASNDQGITYGEDNTFFFTGEEAKKISGIPWWLIAAIIGTGFLVLVKKKKS
jgi:hypothetical protein